MDGSFACPECGCVINLTSLAPGRKVRCDWCQTWVETPYLQRAEPIRRMRSDRAWKRRRRWPPWAWPVAVLLILAITVASASRLVRSRWHSAEAVALTRLIDSSREAESHGRYSEALATIEGALTLAGQQSSAHCDLSALRRHRDHLSRTEAEARLVAMETDPEPGDIGRSVGLAVTLRARFHKDPALTDLGDRIEHILEWLRLEWAESDARSAVKAFDAGKFDQAIQLSEHQHRTADELSKMDRDRLQKHSRTLAGRIISRFGVVIVSVHGQFTMGSGSAYDSMIRPELETALRERGYLPKPVASSWDDLWNTRSPFQVTMVVGETQNEVYLQSPNRLSQIESRLSVTCRGQMLWSDIFKGKTQVPLPKITAYQASRLAVSDHRSAEVERVLYDNAHEILRERFQLSLRNMPPFRTPDSASTDSE